MFQRIGHKVISIKSTGSTNNYATIQVIDNEIKEGTVFLAYEQTAGKGQLSNHWESEAGKNLTFSIFLRPSFLEIHRQFMLSKLICLGVESFLTRYTGGVKIKWPNDIYVGDRKICGILIENAVMNSVISQTIAGIGLNMNQTQFRSDAPNPVSLKMLTGATYDLQRVLPELLKEIDHFYRELRAGHFEELDQAFHERLYRLNEWHTYRDETHQYSGEITGVNAIGQLCIREKNGPLLEYHFKEVEYL